MSTGSDSAGHLSVALSPTCLLALTLLYIRERQTAFSWLLSSCLLLRSLLTKSFDDDDDDDDDDDVCVCVGICVCMYACVYVYM